MRATTDPSPAMPATAAVPADAAWSGAEASAVPTGLPRLLAGIDWRGGPTPLARHRRPIRHLLGPAGPARS